MKKKHIILIVLLVTLSVPFHLMAQTSAQVSAMAGDVFKQEGIASWYGKEFEGRPTASGEIFDASQLTAAHPSLPFGTILVVTNLHNNKSVTVRVNDRGPFVHARIIDVSRAAAEKLDMIITGTAPVVIHGVERIASNNASNNLTVGTQMSPQITAPVAVSAPVAAAPVNTAVVQSAAPVFVSQPVAVQNSSSVQIRLTPNVSIISAKNYRLQVGSYRNAKNALDAFERLKGSGLNPAYERFTSADNVEYYRVVLAGVPGSDVQLTAEKIGAAGFREALIREEN